MGKLQNCGFRIVDFGLEIRGQTRLTWTAGLDLKLWALDKVRAARLDAFEINRASVPFKVAITEEKPSGSLAEKLIVKFSIRRQIPRMSL
jgi:hypothetical protein